MHFVEFRILIARTGRKLENGPLFRIASRKRTRREFRAGGSREISDFKLWPWVGDATTGSIRALINHAEGNFVYAHARFSAKFIP